MRPKLPMAQIQIGRASSVSCRAYRRLRYGRGRSRNRLPGHATRMCAPWLNSFQCAGCRSRRRARWFPTTRRRCRRANATSNSRPFSGGRSINRDRASIIAGIGRYARSQRERAEHIRSSRIAAAENAPATASADSAPTALDWEIRVFDERRRALIYLCEQPVLLDQRAFALGQAIYSHMVKE
jgi:hypothetical protein